MQTLTTEAMRALRDFRPHRRHRARHRRVGPGLAAIVALGAMLLHPAGARAQEPTQEPARQEPAMQQPTPEEIAEMQRVMQELAQPGPEHEMLARMAGDWTQEIVMWPQPGAEPTRLQGRGSSELILGGRFLLAESYMAGSEEPVGVSLMGFDRRSGEYHTLGMDVVGTYWVTASGPPPEEEGGDLVMSGTDYDAEFDYTQVYDFVLRWIDDDTYTWSIVFHDEYHTRGGPPFKMVEITFRRAQ